MYDLNDAEPQRGGLIDPCFAKIVGVLRPGGAFLVYQYTARARRLMRLYFPRVDEGFELFNLPPCVISWGWKA